MFFYTKLVKQKVLSFFKKSNGINKQIIFSKILILKILIFLLKQKYY